MGLPQGLLPGSSGQGQIVAFKQGKEHLSPLRYLAHGIL